MDKQTALTKIQQYHQLLNQTPRDSIEFTKISQASDTFMYRHLKCRDMLFIAKELNFELDPEHTAELIALSYNHADITEHLPLSPEAKLALALRQARQKQHLTQAEVAQKTGIMQDDVVKAEDASISLSLSTWDKLFKAVHTIPSFQFGRATTSESQNRHYTEADLHFKPRDAKQKQEILAWLNNPNVKNTAFKQEIAAIGPEASSKLSQEKILEQYRKAQVGWPRPVG
jgi:transcriptional regulator with XRE-family HTH domain